MFQNIAECMEIVCAMQHANLKKKFFCLVLNIIFHIHITNCDWVHLQSNEQLFISDHQEVT